MNQFLSGYLEELSPIKKYVKAAHTGLSVFCYVAHTNILTVN
jgi:hypothetical protein